MKLPKNHECDRNCDYEDEAHRALRRNRQTRARVKAEFQGDQAWAKAREMLPNLLQIKEKLDTGSSLIPNDIQLIQSAISLVLGEIYLRKALDYVNGQDLNGIQ